MEEEAWHAGGRVCRVSEGPRLLLADFLEPSDMHLGHHPLITRTTDATASALEQDPGRGLLSAEGM